MRTYIIYILFIFLFSSNVFGQTDSSFWNRGMKNIATPASTCGWIQLKKELSISPLNIFKTCKSAFLLKQNDEMILKKQEKDELGYVHYRYQQTYKGILVEGAEYIVHAKNGVSLKANGKIVDGLTLKTTPFVSSIYAIQKAINAIPAEKYEWESPEYIINDSTAQITDSIIHKYPKAELIITRIDNALPLSATNLTLAYRVKVVAVRPISEYYVYINAYTGQLLKKISLMTNANCTCCNGNAYIMYVEDWRTIVTRHRGAPIWNYLLIDRCRGNYIQTYLGKSALTDNDNKWSAVNERPAVSAHWAAEMTYDYFRYTHGRNSVDGNGKRLLLYTAQGAQNNAGWSSDDKGYFYSGDGVTAGHFVSLDVVAHEITHGVTNHSAGLAYQYESGALSESFSDIFGAMVEFAYFPGGGDWDVGEDPMFSGALRSMSNPNLYKNPDTYKGNFWWVSSGDYGGVHTNSGVQNYWFYLLSDGGGGINDKGYTYNVIGINRNKAAAIAYRNLTTYLTSSSDYADAKNGSIFAAMDLYGECSNEVIQTIEAWNAVGVGSALGFGYNISIACPVPDLEYYALNDIIVYGYAAPFNCTVLSSHSLILAAGNSIKVTSQNLSPGKKIIVQQGSYFHAYISPCLSNNLRTENYYDKINDGNIDDYYSLNENHIQEKLSIEDSEINYFTVFPNPFNATTTIQYTLSKITQVKLTIYNSMNIKVAELVNTIQTEGTHQVTLDGTNLSGGIYYCIFETDNYRKVEKVVLVK